MMMKLSAAALCLLAWPVAGGAQQTGVGANPALKRAVEELARKGFPAISERRVLRGEAGKPCSIRLIEVKPLAEGRIRVIKPPAATVEMPRIDVPLRGRPWS